MKKLLTMLTIALILTFCFSSTVLASDLGGGKSYGGASGSGTGGGAGTGSQDRKDGFLATKSGYIVYTSDASGNATSEVVAFCWNGGDIYSTTGAPICNYLQTRFGQTATFRSDLSAAWGYPPFSGSSGAGGAIKNWLLNTPHGGYEKGMDFVMAEVLGFSDDEILAWYADENNRLNVEPFIFGGEYLGSSASSFTGYVIAGNATVWARLVDASNYGGTYTHRNLPNSLAHDILIYPQYPVPSDITSKHDSGTILAHSYGIVTVKPIKGVQIVKVYKTAGVVDQTSYGFTEPPIEVKDEGDYKVKKWHTSKEKTKNKDIKADYPPFVSECPPVQSGSGPTTVDMPPAEKAIFILLEREKEIAPVVLNQEAIRAHELNLIFRYSDGLRDEFNGKNGRFEGSNFRFNDVKHLYEKIPSDTIQNYEMDEDYEVVEEVSGGTAESGRPTHYYKSDDLQVYKAWDEVKDPFALDEIVNPHYSINVSRVFWEDNLHTVEYRDSGYNGYVEEVLGITPSLIGEETSANPGSNVENTLPEVQTNTYKYTAKLQHRWQERDAWEETANDGSTHTAYGSWRDMEEWIEHHIVTYTVNTYCDKFKVMVTPQASIECY